MLTPQQLQQQLDNAVLIATLLQDVSVTFAQIEYTTKVLTAARHKGTDITKRTTANVTLFANIDAATTVFANAVKKSAARFPANNAFNVEAFRAQENYFEHTPIFSIAKHREDDRLYLYCMFNDATSEYHIDGRPATKEQVAAYLTPSGARDLLKALPYVYNKTFDIEHAIVVRTIGLHNIHSIKAMKELIAF